jgi:hypothetical protein
MSTFKILTTIAQDVSANPKTQAIAPLAISIISASLDWIPKIVAIITGLVSFSVIMIVKKKTGAALEKTRKEIELLDMELEEKRKRRKEDE